MSYRTTKAAIAARAAACAMLAMLAAPAGPAAQSSSDDALEPRPGLDPWAVEIEELPAWDLQKSPPPLEARAKRHLEFIQAGVPLEYRSRRNPFPNTPGTIEEGAQLYAANCAACHGRYGRGDGDAGLDLLPSPALLGSLMDKQGAIDEYLLWSVAEGGKPFGTAMPAYQDRLREADIWRIVTYMRAGFPVENDG